MSIDPLVIIGVTSLAVVTIAYALKPDTKSRRSRSSNSSRSRSRSNSLGNLSSSSKNSLGSIDSGRTYTSASSKRSSKSKTKKFVPKIYSV
jgi:hypothetical protein